MSSPAFWIVCALSLGTTLLRETFSTWTPTYFNQFVGLSQARSAFWSSVFPSVGVASVLATRRHQRSLGRGGRSIVSCIGLLIAGIALLSMAAAPAGGSGAIPVLLVGVVALGLIGPYSCLAGAMAMDFGGAQGGAASSGLIDGIGYLGGVLAGSAVARVSVALGWQAAFTLLAIVCLGSALASVLLIRAGSSKRIRT